MKTARALLLCAALLPLGGRAVGAQTLGVSGNPGLLRISTAIAGAEPIAVTNAASTYTVTTPGGNRTYKITAQVNAAMPVGVVLSATLAPPTRAVSAGAVALDLTPRDVVTAIPRNTNSTQIITYQFSATVAAGVIPSSNRIVTLTLVQSP